MGYQCYADDQNAPVLLVTNLEAGETMAVCPEHLADYAVGLLQAVTGQTWAPAPQTPGPGVTIPPGGEPGPGQDDDDLADDPAEDAWEERVYAEDQADAAQDDGDLSDYEDGLGNVVPRSELAQADQA